MSSGNLNGGSIGTLKRYRTVMKCPKSLGLLRERSQRRGQEDKGDDEEEKLLQAIHRHKKERGQGSLTLCQVCNAQLNSSAQAQIHYHGKTHQRKVRQFTKATSAAASHTGRPVPAPLDLKYFLPLGVNGSPSLSLFSNYNTMDPAQKAVTNHTFGVAQPKKKQIVSCNICNLHFNSTNQAEAHYKGHKHARKLKAMDAQRTKQIGPDSTAGRERRKERERGTTGAAESLQALVESNLTKQTGVSTYAQHSGKMPSMGTSSLLAPLLSRQVTQVTPSSQISQLTSDSVNSNQGEEDAVVAKKSSIKLVLRCSTCKVTVNSTSQLDAHCSGFKHKLMLEGHNAGRARRTAKVMSSPCLTFRTGQLIRFNAIQQFHCELCEMSANSETQLQQTKLALQKHLSESLSAGFLARPLNQATLCTTASSSLPFQHPPGHATFVQAPLLSPALFSPAPGPFRATHTPIIFSPY